MDAAAINNEIISLKARLFEIEEIKRTEQPLRDRLNQLLGLIQGIKETTPQAVPGGPVLNQ